MGSHLGLHQRLPIKIRTTALCGIEFATTHTAGESRGSAGLRRYTGARFGTGLALPGALGEVLDPLAWELEEKSSPRRRTSHGHKGPEDIICVFTLDPECGVATVV